MAFEYTVKQCAEKLGISEARVHQLINEGLLPAELIAGRYFVDEDAVEARIKSKPSLGRPPKRMKEDPQKFTLMNRNYEVFDFIYDNHSDEFAEVTRIFDPARAPLSLMSPRGKKVSLSGLTYWWKHRSIPLSRQGLESKLASLGISDPTRIPFKSLGLSLSDQYWLRPAGTNIEWDSINFFNNTFPEMEAADWLDQVGLDSPDNTSEGQLPKRWVQRNGKSYLIKGGGALNQEPYNEVVASCLHRRLLSPDDYVPYTIEHLKHLDSLDGNPGSGDLSGGHDNACKGGEAVSVCRNFLTDKEEYVPAYYVMKSKSKNSTHNQYQHYIECCKQLGVEDIETAVAKMIATDDILGNTDRHLRNFGLIRNVETLEYRAAPLFDTGSSLWSDKSESALINGDISFSSKPFFENPNQQLRLVSDYSWFDAAAITGFAEEAIDILKGNPALENRVTPIGQAIEGRIQRILIIAE